MVETLDFKGPTFDGGGVAGFAAGPQAKRDELSRSRGLSGEEPSMRNLKILAAAILTLALVCAPAALATTPTGGEPSAVPPQRVKTIYVDYPDALQRAKLGAELTVVATVQKDGTVDVQGMEQCQLSHWKRGEVADSDDSCTEFFEAARHAIEGWSYKPAKQDGQPVEARLLIPLSFEKKQTRASIHTEQPVTVETPGTQADLTARP